MQKTFCVRPFLHLASRPDGAAVPCCVGKRFKKVSLKRDSFSKIWAHQEMERLRRRMLDNQPSPLCKVCYQEERGGITSHRMQSNRQWRNILSETEARERYFQKGFWEGPILSLDLRMGNACNLACSMCSPLASSLWEREIFRLQKHIPLSMRLRQPFRLLQKLRLKRLRSRLNGLSLWPFPQAGAWHERRQIWRDLQARLPFVKEITLGGGEPFLIRSQEKIIKECVEKGYAKNIELYYHTNGTLIKPSLFEKWRRFKKVMLFISLDAAGEKNSYIRWPSSFDRLMRNIELIDKESPENAAASILCAVQIKNMYYIPELLECIKMRDFRKIQASSDDLIYTGLVHEPAFLSCQVYPPQVKEKIAKRLARLPSLYGKQADRFLSLSSFMSQRDQSHLLPQFKAYVKALDRSRGTSFERVFPELAKDLFF